MLVLFFFFKQKTAYEMRISDWSSDVFSSDLCNIVNVLSNDRMVMQERSDTAIILGKPCPHQMVAIYELDENGLIKRWREYLDMADLTRKMGVDKQFAGHGGRSEEHTSELQSLLRNSYAVFTLKQI